jgi:hypothetical protein
VRRLPGEDSGSDWEPWTGDGPSGSDSDSDGEWTAAPKAAGVKAAEGVKGTGKGKTKGAGAASARGGALWSKLPHTLMRAVAAYIYDPWRLGAVALSCKSSLAAIKSLPAWHADCLKGAEILEGVRRSL